LTDPFAEQVREIEKYQLQAISLSSVNLNNLPETQKNEAITIFSSS